MLEQRSAFRRQYRLLLVFLAVLAASSAGTACRSTAGTPATAVPVTADTWAVVDGKAITATDVDKVFRRTRDDSQPLSDEETLTAKLTILNDVIVQNILLAKAAALKIDVAQSDLDAAYNNAKKNLSEDAFKQELSRRNLTPEDMRDGLRREMLTQKVIEQEVGARVTVTDKAVTDFFNANRAQFNVPEEAPHRGSPSHRCAINRSPTERRRATTPQAAVEGAMLMERLKAGASFRSGSRLLRRSRVGAARRNMGLIPVSKLKQAAQRCAMRC
jgi:parvulin-like peptidyl-prolyl isomerase